MGVESRKSCPGEAFVTWVVAEDMAGVSVLMQCPMAPPPAGMRTLLQGPVTLLCVGREVPPPATMLALWSMWQAVLQANLTPCGDQSVQHKPLAGT